MRVELSPFGLSRLSAAVAIPSMKLSTQSRCFTCEASFVCRVNRFRCANPYILYDRAMLTNRLILFRHLIKLSVRSPRGTGDRRQDKNDTLSYTHLGSISKFRKDHDVGVHRVTGVRRQPDYPNRYVRSFCCIRSRDISSPSTTEQRQQDALCDDN